MGVLENLQDTIPDLYKPQTSTVILGILKAVAQSDENLISQANNARDQFFVKTASGQGLERLANSLGVSKPASLSLSDSLFRDLVPNLSLKPKQIKKAFYDTAEVFWGNKISRVNIETLNYNSFNLNLGDSLRVSIDGRVPQTIKIESGDVTGGVASPSQVLAWLSQIKGATPEITVDIQTGNQTLNIRTNTPGSSGSIEMLSSSAIGTGKLEFPLKKVDILDQDQRFVVYNVNPNELTIEIPVTVPSLVNTLKGAHHFHGTGVPTLDGNWKGSFLYNPSGSLGNFEMSSQTTTLTSDVVAGGANDTLNVVDTSTFSVSSGDLIFNFGNKDQEFPIPFVSILNSTTLKIDPNVNFTKSHATGSTLNVLAQRNALIPRTDGSDLAVYLPSPTNAKSVVITILEKLKAAGITLKFVVLGPKYKYVIDSPFK